MITTIKTNNPELREEFLAILADNYAGKASLRSGNLLCMVGEQKKDGDEYVFEVEYK